MPFATVRKPLIASALLVCSIAWATQPKSPPRATPKQQPPELPAETLVESTLAGRSSARVYAADVAINHISDGRIRVFDAEKG